MRCFGILFLVVFSCIITNIHLIECHQHHGHHHHDHIKSEVKRKANTERANHHPQHDDHSHKDILTHSDAHTKEGNQEDISLEKIKKYDESLHKTSHHGSHQHSHHHHHNHASDEDIVKKPVTFEAVIYSLSATILISLAPILLITFIPQLGTSSHHNKLSPLLKLLLCFAAGGLLGDAFLHLIPHALLEYTAHAQEQDGDLEQNLERAFNLVGIRVLTGILAFLAVDKFIRILQSTYGDNDHIHGKKLSTVKLHEKIGDNAKKTSLNSATISSSSNPSIEYISGDDTTIKDEKKMQLRKRKNIHRDKTPDQPKPKDFDSDDSVTDSEKSKSISTQKDPSNKNSEGCSFLQLKTSAILNLAADFTHNFTDGLAICASFLSGNSAGFLATITILLHEVPHEIGDYAILMQSGCSKRKAILLQFVTALGALSGTLLGLASRYYFHRFISTLWILPFTAGGFIYIACVTILPDLLDEKETAEHQNDESVENVVLKNKKGSQKLEKIHDGVGFLDQLSPLSQCFLEIGALITGILFMVLLIFYE